MIQTLENRVDPSTSDLRTNARNCLIVPLDFSTGDEAIKLVERLGDSVNFYKIGYELLLAEGPEFWQKLIRQHKKRLFYDAKINDIGETVERAIRTVMPMLVDHQVELLTVNGDVTSIAAAYRGRGELNATKPKILHVTYLSSLDESDLKDQFGAPVDLLSYVCTRADKMLDAGCDGVIASGESVKALREHFNRHGRSALIVVPGVRPAGSSKDDHKRILTPTKAIEYGANYLVVGRPIKNASNPAAAADDIVAEIAEALGAQGTSV